MPTSENSFDPATTLTWDNVKFLENKEALIFIPYSKTTGFNGKVVDVFRIEGDRKCPAAALCKLKKMAEKSGVWTVGKPVFSFPSGRNLTKSKLNSTLAKLLEDFTDECHKNYGPFFPGCNSKCFVFFP